MSAIKLLRYGSNILNILNRSVFNSTKVVQKTVSLKSNFSICCSNTDKYSSNLLALVPRNYFIIPSCGIKVRGQLQLRCKDCYFARMDGQWYVLCDSYPRHKQQALRKRQKYRWILTHCCQSKLRPY